MWDLLAVLAIFALLGVVLELIRASVPRILQANPRMRRAKQAYEESEVEIREAMAQLRQATERRDAAQEAVDSLTKRIAKLKEQIAEVMPHKPVVAREIGKPLKTTALFEAQVVNRYFRFSNRPPMAEKLNPVWARPVLIQVWAISRLEARRIVERNFPGDLGYDVSYGTAFAEPVAAAGPDIR